VIRSSLHPRSLQGHPAWHLLRHQREDVRWWDESLKERGQLRAQVYRRSMGTGWKSWQRRDKRINRKRSKTMSDTDPNANRKADIQKD